MVSNSLADTRENPRFRRYMPLRAAGSDLSEQVSKSLKQRAKKKQLNDKCLLAILIPFAVYN